MTSTSRSKRNQRIVTLTRAQIKSIIHNMGWEEEDADVFLKLAAREMRSPGVLAAEQAAYWKHVREQDAKQQ